MIELNFKNSLMISAAAHIMLILLLPGAWFSIEKKDWIEVSIATLPSEKEERPQWVPGGEPVPEPASRPEAVERAEVPVPAREIDMGLPVKTEKPDLERPEDLEDFISVRDKVKKVVPGRKERGGLIRDEGEDKSEVIKGPVSRRKVIRRIQPEYPGWAERKGVEGEVQLKFWVMPDGHVSKVDILKTSGYPELDSRAMEAMKKYLFSPLGSEEKQETQWGTIIIKYTLKAQ